MKKNNKEGKKFSPKDYMGISVGMGITFGAVLGILIPA